MQAGGSWPDEAILEECTRHRGPSKQFLEIEGNVRLGIKWRHAEQSKVHALNCFAIQLDPWTSAHGQCKAFREITRFDARLRQLLLLLCEEWIGQGQDYWCRDMKEALC